MKQPDAGTGTILVMECPECGRIGLRFITGEDALGQWDRYGASREPAREVPADVPPEPTVVYCSEECGYVAYEDIDWSALPSTGVRIDSSSSSETGVW